MKLYCPLTYRVDDDIENGVCGPIPLPTPVEINPEKVIVLSYPDGVVRAVPIADIVAGKVKSLPYGGPDAESVKVLPFTVEVPAPTKASKTKAA